MQEDEWNKKYGELTSRLDNVEKIVDVRKSTIKAQQIEAEDLVISNGEARTIA